jgi:uncharacterized membrane protein (UPF0127 family)
VTYRVRVRTRVSLGSALLAAVLAVSAHGSSPTTSALRLDGTAFHPELALTQAARSRGLMGRTKAPADGMLFVFPRDTNGGFWMKDTLVPLTIVFFDASGVRVRKLAMVPCRRDPCPVYVPGRAYRFALELRVADTRAGRLLGPRDGLRRLARRAT